MSRSKEKVVSSLRKIFKSNNVPKDEVTEEKNLADADATAKKPVAFPESPGKRIRRLEKRYVMPIG